MDETISVAGNASLELTVSIVKAYVSNNSLPLAGLPDLIASVEGILRTLEQGNLEPEKQVFQPIVPIKKSVTPGYIISLEDGRQYKSLKRHLTGRGLTPDQYREKWNLPRDYPMVAPEYAARRSELAKTAGLGRKRIDQSPAEEPKPVRRGRKPKASEG